MHRKGLLRWEKGRVHVVKICGPWHLLVQGTLVRCHVHLNQAQHCAEAIRGMSRNRWTFVAEISALQLMLEDLLRWTMESLCYFIKLMFRSILLLHHIFILLQMSIASNLSSEFCLLVFFQTPLAPLRPIEKLG